MKTDDKTAAPKADDKLPPLQDRRQAGDDRAPAATALEERDAQDRPAGEGMADGEERQMSRSERMRQEREAAEEQSRKEHAEYNEDLKRREAQAAAKPGEGEQKLFVVYPVDARQPPFHLTNTPNVMLIAAPDEDYARRLAVNEAGHDQWGDPDQVGVEEYKPNSPMVLTRDFQG